MSGKTGSCGDISLRKVRTPQDSALHNMKAATRNENCGKPTDSAAEKKPPEKFGKGEKAG